MAEKYFYGQGRVYVANYGSKDYRWLGDVSQLTLAMETEDIDHKESHSGQRALARRISVDKTGTLSMTLHQIDADNLSMALYGVPASIAAAVGDLTYEIPVGALAGDVFFLPHMNITDTPTVLEIVDSTGSPVTLVRDTDYSVRLPYGEITLLDLTGLTLPFTVTYRHGAQAQIAMFKSAQPELSLIYAGINKAEDDAPVRFEIYRLGTAPLSELPLINNEAALAGLPIEGAVLIDTSKTPADALGQFGRLLELAA